MKSPCNMLNATCIYIKCQKTGENDILSCAVWNAEKLLTVRRLGFETILVDQVVNILGEKVVDFKIINKLGNDNFVHSFLRVLCAKYGEFGN